MAWGVFSLSKEGRIRVAVLLRSLLIAQLVISLCMVIFCYNISLRVMMLLTDIHKVTVFLLYALILLQAYAMKLHYTSGLRLVTWLLKFPHWPRAATLGGVWACSGSCVAANGLLVYTACSTTAKALLKELSDSMRVGISQYLTEPSWKRLLDTMQVELSCCGIDKPSDWHEIPWINVDDLNEDSRLAMKLAGADGKILPPVSPYSCCTPRVLAACYHDPLQQAEWREAWSNGSPLVSASLHTRGCVEAMRGPLTKTLLCLKYFNLLVFMLQLFILVLIQLLRTSARAAALSGDGAGTGRGCVLPLLNPLDTRALARRPSPSSNTEEYHTGESTSLLVLERRRRRNKRQAPPTYPCLS